METRNVRIGEKETVHLNRKIHVEGYGTNPFEDWSLYTLCWSLCASKAKLTTDLVTCKACLKEK